MQRCLICDGILTQTVGLNGCYRGFLCKECDSIITELTNTDVTNINEVMYPLRERIRLYCRREREFAIRYRNLCQIITKSRPNAKRVLEVGSNIGVLSNYLKENGFSVTSVEINAKLVKYQRLVYDLDVYSEIGRLPSTQKYDVIIFMDVVEHIDDFVNYLIRVKKRLNHGGIIYFQFPNKNSMAAKLSGKKWDWWSAPDHRHHFSVKSCFRLAKKLGMHVESIRCCSPVLDDLSQVPVLKYFIKILLKLNELIPLNYMVPFRGGSLINLTLALDE